MIRGVDMKKVFTVFLAVVLCFGITGCSSNRTTASSSVNSTNEVPSMPKNRAFAPENKEEQKKEESVKLVTNYLTGEKTLEKNSAKNRPVAVVIDNSEASLPQYGLLEADVLFEIPVEGNETRFLALYPDLTKLPKVSPIRSNRYYFPIISNGFDALYIHWGSDPTLGQDTLDKLNIDSIDGMDKDFAELFYRDQKKIDMGYSLEHTAVLDGEKLPAFLEENEIRTQLSSEKRRGFFDFRNNAFDSSAGDAAEVRIDFGGGNYSDFIFDDESREYTKFYKAYSHTDSLADEQLSFKNLLILETDITVADGEGRKQVNVFGGNDFEGYYISNGSQKRVSWYKMDESSNIKLFEKNGDELVMNSGKTYIAFVTKNHKTFYKTDDEE